MLVRTLETLLLPPASAFLIILVGLIFLRRRRQPALILFGMGLLILYLSSIPIVSTGLMASLESYPALSVHELQREGIDAIVVLGGGRYSDAPEYRGDTVSRITLERLRYGAWLYRQTGLRVLVSGGSPLGEQVPEAILMMGVLEKEFQVPVAWIEASSRNTLENAVYSGALLKEEGITHIYLVTHAWHMPRAAEVFEKVGLKVTPAPTGFTTPSPMDRGLLAWIPRASAAHSTSYALHEILGRIWYRLRGMPTVSALSPI